MRIINESTAREFANSWRGCSRAATYTKLAIMGLMTASRIMESEAYRGRYSMEMIADNREAIGVLRKFYFELTGRSSV